MTFSCMDRFFLAVIVSGLLLVAVATSLFVATGGERSVAQLTVPPSRILPLENFRPGLEQEALHDKDGRTGN